MLSSVPKALLTHTLASFWRKQSCSYMPRTRLLCAEFKAELKATVSGTWPLSFNWSTGVHLVAIPVTLYFGINSITRTLQGIFALNVFFNEWFNRWDYQWFYKGAMMAPFSQIQRAYNHRTLKRFRSLEIRVDDVTRSQSISKRGGTNTFPKISFYGYRIWHVRFFGSWMTGYGKHFAKYLNSNCSLLVPSHIPGSDNDIDLLSIIMHFDLQDYRWHISNSSEVLVVY